MDPRALPRFTLPLNERIRRIRSERRIKPAACKLNAGSICGSGHYNQPLACLLQQERHQCSRQRSCPTLHPRLSKASRAAGGHTAGWIHKLLPMR